jgi:hypothetical protein
VPAKSHTIEQEMIIDAHNHPNWHGHDADLILAHMDEYEIDQTWLFTSEVSEDEYSPKYHSVLPPRGSGIPLADVLGVGKQAPDRFVLGYMPHPRRPDALERTMIECPETVFIGHAPGFWAHIPDDVRHTTESYPEGLVTPSGRVGHMLRTYPNLYADLSAGSGLKAIDRDREFGRQFLVECSDRLLDTYLD